RCLFAYLSVCFVDLRFRIESLQIVPLHLGKPFYYAAIKTYGCLDGQSKIKQSATGGNQDPQKSACKRRGKRRNARGHPKVASSLS
ncbi:MAG: hypothetical protein ACRDCL_20755, partial [Aeromonas veronii]